MSFESLLNQALNQTFNDEYTRIANRPLGNSESKNIDDVFETITNVEECLICCDDDKICIKCFQCTAFYCKPCLIKIASDFNKCSTCNVTIKDNYKKLKEYNQDLQDTLQYEKAIANSLNEYISSSANKNKTTKPIRPARPLQLKLKNESPQSNKNIANRISNKNTKTESDDSDSDSDDSSSDSDANDNENEHNKKNNDKTKLNKSARKNKNNNAKGNLKPSLMNIFKSNKNEKKETKNDESYNMNFKYNNTSNILDRKQNYLDDLRNDKIYNINFTSYISEISPNKPNYTYEWNHTDKTLNFYALCNNNNDFINIVVNYNILKATFQSVLYVWLNEIVKCSFNIFKVKWNNLATKINHFSTKSEDDVTVKDIKKFTKKIVNICKN
jgi:hypothetical protein